jgi:hypothetical protein
MACGRRPAKGGSANDDRQFRDCGRFSFGSVGGRILGDLEVGAQRENLDGVVSGPTESGEDRGPAKGVGVRAFLRRLKERLLFKGMPVNAGKRLAAALRPTSVNPCYIPRAAFLAAL